MSTMLSLLLQQQIHSASSFSMQVLTISRTTLRHGKFPSCISQRNAYSHFSTSSQCGMGKVNPDGGSGSDGDEDEDAVHVHFETSAGTKTVSVQRGEVLRTAMLKRGVSPHNGKSRLINCRGLGTCGTCAVEVRAKTATDNDNDENGYETETETETDSKINIDANTDAIVPRDRNTRENLRLNFPPHGSNDQSSHLRLACQIQINGDVHVKKRSGFWGQNATELADEYDAELYFGDLEFVLDQKSPSQSRS